MCGARGFLGPNLVPLRSILKGALLLFAGILALFSAHRGHAAVSDLPFRQELTAKLSLNPELQGAALRRLAIDRDGVAYVLTERGLARLFEDRLALDHAFRPLVGKVAQDISLCRGRVFYLFEDRFLANDFAGKQQGSLPAGAYRHLAVGEDFSVLLSGTNSLALFKDGVLSTVPFAVAREGERLYAWGGQFYVLAADSVYRVNWPRVDVLYRGRDLTALGFRGTQVWVGTKHGYLAVDLSNGRVSIPLQTQLPATEITSLAPTADGLWAGTTRGAFFQSGPNRFRYYASRRWLSDDRVVDLQPGRAGEVMVLTETGLNKINFRAMTLAQKAALYDKKIRQRHMRYGLCAELVLRTPGDITTEEMVDTDNDGSWSSYYLASQAFRYAVTGEEEARANAWETFDALERLQTITPLDGFPARTFERRGFKFSDPDRWHVAANTNWEWKATTSSDEIAAQTFAYAVLYETVARTPTERARIAAVYDKMASHIVRNNLYLVDVNGQPTLWGRWNPEYVNHYPPSIVDRRLNSSEIIAVLQLAYRMTGKELYRARGFELLERYGYLRNITNSMTQVQFTPGFLHQGEDMGDEWNHSDDLLAFVNYWTLYRFAFNETLRQHYAAAIRDHWNIEKIERCPIWNFVYAMSGAQDYDLTGALWTLQYFPIDLVNWTVTNSQREDLHRLPDNFRKQQSVELLPPDERPLMRWNGNPFALDGGSGGGSELAGDEFLLPYWMGRFLRIIQ